ncbi:hypothetical protein EXE41_05650 [Halorubrum sp. SD690R]|nr:hypothetical protein EXE41_05650 [Halorubrum sp. SD690R]
MRSRSGAGLEGAAARTKHDEASTAGANGVSDEEHSESRESSRLGLRWSQSPSSSFCIERLGLRRCSSRSPIHNRTNREARRRRRSARIAAPLKWLAAQRRVS